MDDQLSRRDICSIRHGDWDGNLIFIHNNENIKEIWFLFLYSLMIVATSNLLNLKLLVSIDDKSKIVAQEEFNETQEQIHDSKRRYRRHVAYSLLGWTYKGVKILDHSSFLDGVVSL